MLEGITLYSTQYYEKSVFMGSYRGMNFRVMKAGEKEQPVLQAIVWKGPLGFEKTEEEKVTEDFEFSEKGLLSVSDWLEEQQKAMFQENN